MKLADLIEYILDETDDNELVLSFKRDEGGRISIVVRDDLSDIGYVRNEYNTEHALKQMQEQLQQFVDERMASR